MKAEANTIKKCIVCLAVSLLFSACVLGCGEATAITGAGYDASSEQEEASYSNNENKTEGTKAGISIEDTGETRDTGGKADSGDRVTIEEDTNPAEENPTEGSEYTKASFDTQSEDKDIIGTVILPQ